MRTFFLAWLVHGAVALAAAPPLIHTENPIGSDWEFNPLSHYLNLAFDTTQNPTYFSQSRFFANHGVLWERIKDPFASIRREGGLGTFLGNEVFGFRALPNYTLHLIGGGYDYRWLAEWYDAEGVPYPYVVAFLNGYLANLSNEALETSARQVNASDHIADLFLFDIAGKILFMSDGVVRFFRNDLQMHAWHYQPSFNLRALRIDNAGSNYIFRPYVLGERFRPFIHLGMSILAGVSMRVDGEYSLTAAGGIAPTDPLLFRGDPMVAFFWDRRDALLASLSVKGSSALIFRLNVYPDFVDTGRLRTGFFLSYANSHEVALGLTVNMPIGLSVSF